MKKRAVTFIPTHYFCTVSQEWNKTNPAQSNWAENKEWMKLVYAIYPITNEFVLVTWNNLDEKKMFPTCNLYKGFTESLTMEEWENECKLNAFECTLGQAE
jgi:hypothetical protein